MKAGVPRFDEYGKPRIFFTGDRSHFLNTLTPVPGKEGFYYLPHCGEGGTAIYNADMAELRRLEALLERQVSPREAVFGYAHIKLREFEQNPHEIAIVYGGSDHAVSMDVLLSNTNKTCCVDEFEIRIFDDGRIFVTDQPYRGDYNCDGEYDPIDFRIRDDIHNPDFDPDSILKVLLGNACTNV